MRSVLEEGPGEGELASGHLMRQEIPVLPQLVQHNRVSPVVAQAPKEYGQICIVSHTFTSSHSLSDNYPYLIARDVPGDGSAPDDAGGTGTASTPDADFGVTLFAESVAATNVGVSGRVSDALVFEDLPEAGAVVNVRADEQELMLLFDNGENNCIAFRGAYGEG